MAVLEIPVRNDLQAYSFTIELDGTNYLLRFRYNSRISRWAMDVAKTDGTNVVAGIPLLTNTDLLGRFELPDLPPGRFLAYDETGAARNAELEDLGSGGVLLLYQEANA